MHARQRNLFIVFLAGNGIALDDHPDVTALSEGLYLVLTEQTRSQLYLAIKRRTAPRQLLVAQLADLPKFKGMMPGCAKKMKLLLGDER